MSVKINGTSMFSTMIDGNDKIMLNNNDDVTTSGIDYISFDLNTKYSTMEPEAWVKWGEYSYCYTITEALAFQAIALFLDTESLGKVGNFIKKNGVVNWSDSPTCEVG